jgi:hypothetical protein
MFAQTKDLGSEPLGKAALDASAHGAEITVTDRDEEEHKTGGENGAR